MNEKIDVDTIRGLDQESKDAILREIFRLLSNRKTKEVVRAPKQTKKAVLRQALKDMKQGEFISFDDLCNKTQMLPLTTFHQLYTVMKDGYVGMQICKTDVIPDDYVFAKNGKYASISKKPKCAETKKVTAGKTQRGMLKNALENVISCFSSGDEIASKHMTNTLKAQGFKKNSIWSAIYYAEHPGNLMKNARRGVYVKT